MHYLIAATLRNQGGEWEQRRRVPEEFEAAIKPGKTTEWYGDALYNYAVWMEGVGQGDGRRRRLDDAAELCEGAGTGIGTEGV